MRKLFLNIISFVFLAVTFSTAYTVQAQVRAYRVSDRQVQTLLARIEVRTDDFKRQVDRGLDRSTVNGTSSEDSINSFISAFETSTDNLRTKFENRRDVAADVQEVLSRASFIEGFMRDYRLNARAQSTWTQIRTDLNTLAGYYNVTWNPNTSLPNTTNPYTVSTVTVRNLLTRIETNTDQYRRQMSNVLERRTLNNAGGSAQLDAYITDFENATDALKERFNANRSVNTDVQEVLTRAAYIDSIMRNNRFSARTQQQWNVIRTDLNTLSNYYNVSWNWSNPLPTNPGSQYGMNLTGTYRLNVSQSDNVTNIIDSSVRGSINTANNTNQTDRIRRNLERRLASPEMLVIDKVNNRVTIASNLSPQVAFDADGVRRTETNPNGRSVSVRATSVSSGLEIAYEGDRTNDFFLTFMPMNNGQLRVTRRVYLENQNTTVTVNSVYDKVSQTADFSSVDNVRNTAQNNQNYPNNTISNDFVIPNGTQVVATLTSMLSTNAVNEGDRFTMEVTSPSQYRGAIIEGYVSNTQRSGRVTGRAQATFNFETIKLRNGNSYRFSGLIDQVRQPNGDTVSVNNEGAVRDGSQTTRTATRAGIGAALGAIIGAIAGGGSGAAIGAGVGAGAGAGTVILQGRDNLELQSGTEFRITSSAPGNVRANY